MRRPLHTSRLYLGATALAFAFALAVPTVARAQADNVVLGVHSSVEGTAHHSIIVGTGNAALGAKITDSNYAIAIGNVAEVIEGSHGSIAIGNFAKVANAAKEAVALGSQSEATESNTVSVGNSVTQRRIVNVAAGTAATDAVNKGQLDAVANTASNAQTAANTANSKFTSGAVDASFKSLDAGSGTIQTSGALSGGTLATTGNATVGGVLSAQGANFNGQTVGGVAAGVNADDAVNKSQLDAVIIGVSAAASDAAAAQDTANTARSEAAVAHTVAIGAQSTADTALATLQSTLNQMLEAGLCTISGASVTCGTNLQLAGGSVAAGVEDGIAIGQGAEVQSSGGIAMGRGATAVQSNSVAIGAGAHAHSSVAVGTGALATGTNTTAVGDNAVASGEHAVALGNEARAMHDNAVALGNGSATSATNTVSIGSPGAERRITHVAGPLEASDAATKGYVDEANSQAMAHASRLSAETRKHAARGIAATAAMMNVTPSQAGRTAIGVAAGHYDGQSAIGVTATHALTANHSISLGIAASSGGKAVTRAGVAWEF